MPAERVIEVAGLRKSYGPVVAVDGIDLTMLRGEVLVRCPGNTARFKQPSFEERLFRGAPSR